MIPLNSVAPDFNLLDTVSNSKKTLSSLKGKKGTVIFFICNHSPFVIHVNNQLVKLANDYLSRGIGFVAISSNDVENYPQDAPKLMSIQAKKENYPFPYLYDESQDIAKAYGAVCTPDFFGYNADLELQYRGRLDDSGQQHDRPDARRELFEAMQLIAARTGQEYNIRKQRKGAFWEDRYHASAIEQNSHLNRCLVYIDF